MWGRTSIERFQQNIHYSLRSMRRNVGLTCTAVLVMALGIGANSAVFSVVNAVLLKPLGYQRPDRIVSLSSAWKQRGDQGPVSAPDFQDWHDQSNTFAALAYYTDFDIAVLPGPSAEYAHVARVAPEFFSVFEISAPAGRFFSADEEKPGSSGAAIISYSYWQTHFNGDARALGKTIRAYDKIVTVVGITPAGFRFPQKTDIWVPTNTLVQETPSRGAHNYRVVGRLKDGVNLEQAQAQMDALGLRLEQQYPSTNKGKGIIIKRLQDEMVRSIRLTLYILLGAVSLVALIACGNVANLLLAKATARQREVAIRAAIGASRHHIIWQMLTESTVLAVIAGIVGLATGIWGAQLLVTFAPANLPRLTETGIDARVLAFTFGVSIISSVLFGLAPALHASRVDLNEMLKQGSAQTFGGRSAGRLRGVLVVAEIALSVILLVGAGLLIKSFLALHNVALGYSPENILIVKTSMQSADLDGARRATRLYKTLLAEVATLPGVSAVGATRTPPGQVGSNGSYWIDHPFDPTTVLANSPTAVFSVVAPGSFAALRIPLRRGRDFQDNDTFDAPFRAIINEALARKAFPGQDPIGHHIVCGLDSPNPMEIIGVVGDVRQYGPAREPSPEIYMPFEQHPRAATALSFLVRTVANPAVIQQAIRKTGHELAPAMPMKFTTMEADLSENVAAPRFRTLLLGIFAAVAVCLAMVGVYGVLAYLVTQRSSEIGLRMALGAKQRDIVWLVTRQGLTLVAAGLVSGFAVAVLATRVLSSMLFGVKPTDPGVYFAVLGLLGIVALIASYVPARRAARIDPLQALRQD
jgi:putative ABC transport system permease protein